MITLIVLSIFANIKAWGISTVVSGILGIGIVKKWAMIVDKWAKFVSKWSNTIGIAMQKGSVALFSVHDTAELIDSAIAEDGTTNFNTLKEAFEAGKKVKVELEDMIVEFKPKK